MHIGWGQRKICLLPQSGNCNCALIGTGKGERAREKGERQCNQLLLIRPKSLKIYPNNNSDEATNFVYEIKPFQSAVL